MRRIGWVLGIVIAVVVAFSLGRGSAEPSADVRPSTVTRPATTRPATTRPPSVTRPSSTTSIVGPVSKVVDGDTIDAAGERVRVVGIDTPERGDCGFDESSARMAELVEDRTVAIVGVPGQTLDRYRRLLGYVEVDGEDVGARLIEEGLAIARYDSRDGYPAHPREDEYHQLDAASPDRCG